MKNNFELAMEDAESEDIETLEAGADILNDMFNTQFDLSFKVSKDDKWPLVEQLKDLLEHVGAEVQRFDYT